MALRCPHCAGRLYDATEPGTLDHGRTVSCLMCGRLWFERTASPPQEWAPARPGRPRKLLTRRPPGELA